MIKFDDIKNIFLNEFKWIEVFNLEGAIVVSPDYGSYKRVFCFDEKIRLSGRYLYGTVGIFHEKMESEFGHCLPFSSYITNFEEFSDPPPLDNFINSLNYINLIVNFVKRLPADVDELILFYNHGKFNSIELYKFMASSSYSEAYIKILIGKS